MVEVSVKHSLFQRAASGGRTRWMLSVSINGAPWRQLSAPKEIQAKRLAQAWATGELAKIRKTGELPGTAARTGIPVRVLVDRVIDLRRKMGVGRDVAIRQSTMNTLEARARVLKILWGDRLVDGIAVPDARALIRGMKETHAPNTIRGHVTFAKQAWDIGKAEGWIGGENPFRNVMVSQTIPRAVSIARKPLALSLEMADALINGAIVPPFRRARNVVIMGAGLSNAEVCGLRVGDVSFTGTPEAPVPHIRVMRQLAAKGKKYVDVKTENRNRWVPMAPVVAEGLAWWLGEPWQEHTGIGRGPKASDPLFPKRGRGGVFKVAHGPSQMRADLRALGMPDHVPGKDGETLYPITTHAGRRTFATLLESVGVTDADVGAVMGHTGSTITASSYIARHLVRLHGELARHPLRFSYVQNTVRTGKTGAQARGPKVAKAWAESLEMPDVLAGSSCFSASVRSATQSDALAALCVAVRAKRQDQNRNEDHAHKPKGAARTTREHAIAYAALEWAGAW